MKSFVNSCRHGELDSLACMQLRAISRDGSTVLKLGGQILRAKRAEIFFDLHFLASGGTKYCLDS